MRSCAFFVAVLFVGLLLLACAFDPGGRLFFALVAFVGALVQVAAELLEAAAAALRAW